MSRLGDADARRRGVRDERVSESVGEGSPQHPLEGNFAPHSRPGAADVGRTAHPHALPQAACRGAASRRFARLAVHPPRRRPLHPHRLTHPFQVVPGVYGVTFFAFLLRSLTAFLSSLLIR